MIRIGKYIVRTFSPLWWVMNLIPSAVVLWLFLAIVNLVG